MPESIVFGDAEAAVCAILTADSAIADSGATVATDLVGWDTTQPWVRVVRSGGTPILWQRLDAPHITIDTYAPDKAAAHDLAAAARAAVFAARGAYTGNGLLLCDVTDFAGLAWLPDDTEPTIARYVFMLALVTRPA